MLIEPCHLVKLLLCVRIQTQHRLNVLISSQWFPPGRVNLSSALSTHKLTLTSVQNGDANQMFSLPFTLSVQFSSASGACVGGHRTGGQRALHLCMGLLHRADCVHPQGCAHTRHRLPGLRPRGTGTVETQNCLFEMEEYVTE